MDRIRLPKRNRNRPRRASKRALRIESLSHRVLLHGSGLGVTDPLPWFDPGALTYSFAPDGTNVAGYESELFARLSSLSEIEWQTQFDSAFNAWLTPLGATIGQVADSGSRFGVAGPTQDDLRFGDVRIAAIPLTEGVLASTVPHSAMVQGTWAGDILLNANHQWSSLQEIFSVAMHEFGHVLGLQHSDDPASVMHALGDFTLTAPTTEDIRQLTELYAGIDFEDVDDETDLGFSPSHGHSSGGRGSAALASLDRDTAVALNPVIGSTIRYTAGGTLTSPNAFVVYELQPIAGDAEDLENLTVVLRDFGSSGLQADVKVFDSIGNLVESRVLHHGQGTTAVQAVGVDSSKPYYVVISAAQGVRPESQVGQFELIADYGPELRVSKQLGQIRLSETQAYMDQPISVDSSRLVHIHLEASGEVDPETNVRAELVDSENRLITRFTVRPGTSRSAPLTFLSTGDFTLRLIATTAKEALAEIEITIFMNEVSIDIGPGPIDPTDIPIYDCHGLFPDPNFCITFAPIHSFPPEVPSTPPPPAPAEVPDGPTYPGPDFPWWWNYDFSIQDYNANQLSLAQSTDPLWWDYYQTVNPTNPRSSPWQNPVNQLDVSRDGDVSAIDALIVVNMMARGEGQQIQPGDPVPELFADVNGDFRVTALDALVVINSLATTGLAAQAESVQYSAAAMTPIATANANASRRDENGPPALLF